MYNLKSTLDLWTFLSIFRALAAYIGLRHLVGKVAHIAISVVDGSLVATAKVRLEVATQVVVLTGIRVHVGTVDTPLAKVLWKKRGIEWYS